MKIYFVLDNCDKRIRSANHTNVCPVARQPVSMHKANYLILTRGITMRWRRHTRKMCIHRLFGVPNEKSYKSS